MHSDLFHAHFRKYRNRKGLWGITVLAGCDARGKFMMFSCNGSGSANDVLAWRWSAMKNDVVSPDDGKSKSLLPENYFFIGDEAFVCEKQFLVPFSGRGIGSIKDSFNFHLSVRRQVIERYVLNYGLKPGTSRDVRENDGLGRGRERWRYLVD